MQTQILNFYYQLKALPNLRPSPEVDVVFQSLCHFAKTTQFAGDEAIFESEEVKWIRQTCGQAEFEMEKYRADRTIQSQDPRATLQDFPYLHNYQLLTDLEVQPLKTQKKQLKKLIFVGSGPLPLTAVLLAQEYGISAVLIERNPEAVSLSRQLIEKLGLPERITVIESDFLDFRSEEHFDAVVMASLLFSWENQAQLLAKLSSELNFDLALIRSAEGMRQLLYQKVNLNLIKSHLKPQLIVHPHNEIINSVLLCTKH